ncbi:receptor-like protein kinase, partial [Trifolium pratense]
SCSSFSFKTESWKNSTDCCDWDGVTCDTVSDYVIGLDLSCNNLKGELHPNSTIFQLRHLQQLNLAFNDFSGSSVHVGIGDLVNLTHLNLSNSYFSGNIPSTISRLSKLVSLDLSNHLVMELKLNPFTWKKLIRNATDLRELYLDSVDLSSIRVSSLSMLKNFSSSLVSLSLSYTRLHGHLSSDILSLPNLQKLELSYNNNLSGQLPKSNWSTPLRYLYISFSAFSGEIPYSIDNDFSGNIPPNVYGKLNKLEFLTLYANNLTGIIPSSIFQLPQLSNLRLSDNKLVGPIPIEVAKRSKLKVVSLGYNMLNGTIPKWCYYLPSLVELYLSNNHLTGFIARLPNLQSLDLSHNNIHGKIPKWFLKLFNSWENIGYIDLSFNKLQGNLPIPPSGIQYFLLSNNNFTGNISSAFCNAWALSMLNLAHNKITGMIPQCLGTLPSLSVLDLQMNNFYGSMPRNFSKENQFETIKLNGNQLEGPLPYSLVHCKNLEVLDLGDNIIEDVFPNWLGILPELQVLSLRSNKLHGTITCSSTKHPFTKLRIFDVSNNNFSGPLPTSCIKKFQGMMNVNGSQIGLQYMGNFVVKYYNDSVVVIMKGFSKELTRILTTFTTIDLSNNMFEGEIPTFIGELNSLKGLNLSNNGISGKIPQSLSYLENLEWLDLSRNQLIGEIPMALTKLNFLSFLNLSQNHLEGIIPTGQQFGTFGNDSYEGNT